MFIVVERLRVNDSSYGYDMRIKAFNNLSTAWKYIDELPERLDLYENYDEVYEMRLYQLGK